MTNKEQFRCGKSGTDPVEFTARLAPLAVPSVSGLVVAKKGVRKRAKKKKKIFPERTESHRRQSGIC